MKDTFRQSMKWLHTWVGLVVGWILFFMFLTGTTGYFYKEITRWMEPERPLIAHNVSNIRLIDNAESYLNTHAEGVNKWTIYLPSHRDANLKVGWREPPLLGEERGEKVNRVLDVNTGKSISTRETGGGQILYRMHYRLHYLSTKISYWVVGFCTMLMLLAVITGVIIHKKIFSDFFTFRAKKGLPGWLDSHNVLSVIALPYHFMITYSGLLFFLFTYMVLSTNIQVTETELDEMIDEIYPKSAEVRLGNISATMQPISSLYQKVQNTWPNDNVESIVIHAANDINAKVTFYREVTDITYNANDEISFNGITGDRFIEAEREYTVAGRIQNGLFSLHEGQFADTVTRWIYIVTGLIGAAMVASGLVLWTTKRKPQQLKKINGADFGYRLVEQLNIGTIVGLPIAMAMYFYANRLLPVNMAERVNWEANIMFISWAVLLIYPAFRPKAKAWLEQLTLGAAVFIFMPILNGLTTNKHLGITLKQGDWQYAGFDITMLFIGIIFVFSALKFQQSQRKKISKKHRSQISPAKMKRVKETELVLSKESRGG
jgi:uncharacterized iron-regulated membrane protein